ncbi:MAG: hypothetical protein LBU64_12200, partial [Planctomycetota bacterium]|nr:hypothetical protein [Planctomycetota bacterium]
MKRRANPGMKLLIGLAGLSLGASWAPLAAAGGEAPAFAEIFGEIAPEDIADNVFTLVGKEWTVITAGAIPGHNSMVASFGGFGILFEKPAAWCFLRANRFTLEKIRAAGIYTMSYFPERYRNDILLFGTKSGRNSDKM